MSLRLLLGGAGTDSFTFPDRKRVNSQGPISDHSEGGGEMMKLQQQQQQQKTCTVRIEFCNCIFFFFFFFATVYHPFACVSPFRKAWLGVKYRQYSNYTTSTEAATFLYIVWVSFFSPFFSFPFFSYSIAVFVQLTAILW